MFFCIENILKIMKYCIKNLNFSNYKKKLFKFTLNFVDVRDFSNFMRGGTGQRGLRYLNLYDDFTLLGILILDLHYQYVNFSLCQIVLIKFATLYCYFLR